jgi:hypothetical protein
VRTTLAISALAHALVWSALAFSGPAPLGSQSSEPPVLVDIIAPDELENAGRASEPTAPQAGTDRAEPAAEHSPPPQDQSGQTRKTSDQPQSPANPARSAAGSAAATEATQAGGARSPSEAVVQPWSTWFDTALSSPLVRASAQYDAAEAAARLSQAETAALKARLQECWHRPAALDGAERLLVVLRVSLKRNGELMAEPALLAASASEKGAALMQTALRALRQCQPYAFLPAAKYNEWKLLDLNFSAAGLTGQPVF